MSSHLSTVVLVWMISGLSGWHVMSVNSQQWDQIDSFRLHSCRACNCYPQIPVCNTRNERNDVMSFSFPVVNCTCTCKRLTGIVCSSKNQSDSDITVLAAIDLGRFSFTSMDACVSGTQAQSLCDGHTKFNLTPLFGNETSVSLLLTRTIFRCSLSSVFYGCWYCESPLSQDMCTGVSPETTTSLVSTRSPSSNNSSISTINTDSASSPVSNTSAATATKTATTLPGSFTSPNTNSNHHTDSHQATTFQTNRSLASGSPLNNYTDPTTNSSISSEPVIEDTTTSPSSSTTPNTAESSNNEGETQDSSETRTMIIIVSILAANAILAVLVCILILNRRRKVNLFYRRQLKAARAAKSASRAHMSFNHHNSSADNTQIKTFF